MGIRGKGSQDYGYKELELRRKSKLLDFIRRKIWEQMDGILDSLEDHEKYIKGQYISTWFFKDVYEMDLPDLYREWYIFEENFGSQIKRSRDRYEISVVDFEDMDLIIDDIIRLMDDLEDLIEEHITLEV